MSFSKMFSFGNGAKAVAVVQPTFDEAMCKRFNRFYDEVPLPQGRVRPVFSEAEPHLKLVACSDYNPLVSERRSTEVTPKVQTIFINFFNQFEPFPSNLSMNCGTTLKVLKLTNKALFYSPLKWFPASPNLKNNLVPIMCKLNFLYGIVEHVTKPVVLLWDKYIQDNQQPLDRYQEEYLSTLLQCKLLEGMDSMVVEQTSDQYVPTDKETAHFRQFKQRLQQLQEQLELQKLQNFRLNNPLTELSQEQQIDMMKTHDEIFELGGSKYKRQRRQRSKRQRRQRSKRRRQRQKSKKYYK
jgi:hypothetical protein